MTEQIALSIKSAALALDMPYAKVAWFQSLPAGTTSPKDER